jgi:hypothetical protein
MKDKASIAGIDKTLHFALKVYCIKRQVTMTRVIEELIKDFLKRSEDEDAKMIANIEDMDNETMPWA